MKSQFHTLSFLANYTPKSPLDAEFIKSFLVQRFNITPRSLRNAPNFASNPLDVYSFIRWFESGLEALKIARWQNRTVLLGNCTLENCEIIASTDEKGSLTTEISSVAPDNVFEATEDEIDSFQSLLLENNLQPNPKTLRMVPRHIPAQGERVIFYDMRLEVQGVGVVREITSEGDVAFFCYFTYPTNNRKKELGYSTCPKPTHNLRTILFENIDRDNVPTILGNSTSCFRRLGRELQKAGKVWKDKLLRVEPLEVELGKGEKYYYISDKLKVVTEVEKKTPNSHKRYLAGNYFTSHLAATKMLGKINDLIAGYLASDEWPDIFD